MKTKLFGVLLIVAIVLGISASAQASVSVLRETAYDAVIEATGDDEATCERPDLPGVFVTQDVCNVQAAVDTKFCPRI